MVPKPILVTSHTLGMTLGHALSTLEPTLSLSCLSSMLFTTKTLNLLLRSSCTPRDTSAMRRTTLMLKIRSS